MITSCPNDWSKDDDIRKKCERLENQITDYTYDLDSPVVSRITNTTYVNMYCAQCHRDTQLETMEAQLECNVQPNECVKSLLNASYAPTMRLWGRQDGFLAWFHMPQLVSDSQFRLQRRIRMCRPSVDQCDPEWPANTTETQKCQSFASYITKTSTTSTEIFDPDFPNVFKNPFCATCNYIDLFDNQECKMHLPSTAPQAPMPEIKIRASFSLLLDFSGGGHDVGTVSRCRRGQMFDSMHDKCIDLPCGRLFDAVDGVCKAKNDIIDHKLILLNDSCPKIIRNASDFNKLQNGSIIMISSGRVYHMGQYEVQDDVILICNDDEYQITSKFSAMQSTLSLIVLLVSVFFLTCHISIYGTFSKLRNLPGKSLLSLSVMLLCGQVLFFGVTRIRPGGFCEFIAVMMHFCFLSSFFWMNVMAVDICRTFTVLQYHSTSSAKKYKQYASYAWGFSALIVGSSIIVDNSNLFPTLKPNYGNAMCWISQRRGLLVFFAVPLAILLIENVIFFILTARGICRTTEEVKSIKKTKQKIRFFLYVKLALIMGFTWIIGFVAALAELDALWYGFIVLNGLQGTFIFFAFSFKKKVFIMVKEKYFTKKTNLGGSGKPEKKLSKSQATSMTNLNTTVTRISTSNLNINAVNAV
uniref:G-protein coupled receptors family 2 profile 2 domain-containing protein n=1 Tax=Strigamia maritima TaxID=126957 RepID=T1JFW2_STRMM